MICLFRIASMLFAALLIVSSAQAETDCPPLMGWQRFLAPGEQEYELVERIELGGDRFVTGVSFGALVGEYAKVHLFLLGDGACDLAVVSLGSYAMTNAISEGPRVYHLDLYEPETHSTLDFFEDPPTYSALRAEALEVFKALEQ